MSVVNEYIYRASDVVVVGVASSVCSQEAVFYLSLSVIGDGLNVGAKWNVHNCADARDVYSTISGNLRTFESSYRHSTNYRY
jgi:hypothetical protein